jgi:hypothetical protein
VDLQRNRGFVADGAMWALLVVVSAPILHFRPGVVKCHEPVCVQTFRPDASVEGLDEGVVGRLTRPREVQGDALAVRPQIKVPCDELRSLIDPDGFRIANLAAGLLQRLNDVLGSVAEPGINDRRKGENVSTTVNTLIFLPVANWSCTKSIAQISLGCVAAFRSSRSFALTRRFGVLLRSCSPISL